MSQRSRALALVLSLVPGWGHIHWGREKLGLTIFTVFALAAFALLNGLLMQLGEWQRVVVPVAAALAVLTFLGGFLDMFLRSSVKRVEAETQARERLLREGMIAFLVDDLERAADAFHAVVALDPVNIEAFFRLVVIWSRRGDARRAASWRRRLGRFDVEGKWTWEVERELDRAREARAPPAAGATLKSSSGGKKPTDRGGTRTHTEATSV